MRLWILPIEQHRKFDMCGIAGIYQRTGRAISTQIVREMGLLMTHRGPDNLPFSGVTRLARDAGVKGVLSG
jgi:glutamate synthase domain-containing protein 1